MSALLVALWPGERPSPTAVLAITYDPPLRAPRRAPPSLRDAPLTLDAADLAAVFASMAPREAR